MDDDTNHAADEFLTSADLRHRYKRSSKTIREWELSGVLPTPTRVGNGMRARKLWRRSVLEQAEREGLSRKSETIDA